MGTLDKPELASPTPKKQRGRSKKSVVWDHFTVMDVGGDCFRACCKQCNKSYAYCSGTKMSGTSHLKRHIETGPCSITRLKDKNLPSEPPKKRQRATNGALTIPFNQNSCNNEIAKMIILHDYQLEMVDHPGFIQFAKSLQPQFENASSATIYNECMAIFSTEKSKLSNLLSEISGRISLTLNMWNSDVAVGYAVLSAHFIDNDWKLHRKLLNIISVPFPDSEKAFNHAILSCLSNWGIETRLFALTLDRSIANEPAIANLRTLLSVNNPHMSKGQFLIGSCFAHILTSLALDSISAMSKTVQRVRNCVKFVTFSEVNEERFMQIKVQLQVPSNKSLAIDNCTRWDSTYHMLCAAAELKEVFACLDTEETISLEEWTQIETLCGYLNCLYEASGIITAEKYPTADKFFAQVCTIQLKLFSSLISEDPFESNLIKPLIDKFEIYWKDCSFVLAMAVVMDPRYKLKLVDHFFSQLYREQAESFLNTVKEAINALYLEYVAESLPLISFDIDERQEEEVEEKEVKTEDHGQEELFVTPYDDPFCDIFISDISSNEHTKSELDHYLEEYLLHSEQEDFDILEWWKVNRIRYPTLSNMAADLLSIPLSTVPGDSVFDTVSRKVDSYRGSMVKPEAIEAFACAKDWLQSAVTNKDF